jgi:predicted phosphodiesterase
MATTLAQELSEAREVIRQKNVKLNILERDLRRRAMENESAERVRKEIFGLAEYSPDPPKWLNQEPGKSSTGIPIITLGDWHIGETVDPDQVGGVNKFNREIAKRRVRNLAHAVDDLCFNHMTNPNYPGAVVLLLGDFITGCLHDDLTVTNDGPLTFSIQDVQDYIIGLLKFWAKKFKHISVVCVPGNHGRSTIKPRLNNKIYESWEWLIYCNVEKYFRDDARVKVYVPNAVDAFFSVFGHKFMVTHGDTLGVTGGDSLIGKLGPISRGTMKLGAQQRSIGKDFDTLVIGHFHFYMPRGDATPVYVNPCLIGHNTYAHLQLRVRASKPAQSLIFLHSKRGFTCQWPVLVDEPRTANHDPWFVWGGQRTNRELGLGLD